MPDSLGWVQIAVRCLQQSISTVFFTRIFWAVNQIGVVPYVIAIFLCFSVSALSSLSCYSILHRNEPLMHAIQHRLSSAFSTSLSLLLCISACLAASIYTLSLAETLLRLLETAGFDISHYELIIRLTALVFLLLSVSSTCIRHGRGTHVRIFLLILTLLGAMAAILGSLVKRDKGKAVSPPLLASHSLVSALSLVLPIIFPAVFCTLMPTAHQITSKKAYLAGSLSSVCVSYFLYSLAGIAEKGAAIVGEAVNGTEEIARNPLSKSTTFPVLIGVFVAGLVATYSSIQYATRCWRDVTLYLPSATKLQNIYCSTTSVTAISALFIVIFGSPDDVSLLATVFYLTSYGLVSYAAFSAVETKSLLARWSRLFSVCLCLVLSLLVGWQFAIFPAIIFAIVYTLLKSNKNDVSVPPACLYSSTINGLHQLQNVLGTQFRPQLLVLTGNPAARPALVDFAHNITKGDSLMICGYVVPQPPSDRTYLLMQKIDKQITEWLERRHIAAFGVVIPSVKQCEGATTILQTCGLGCLRPNILLMGFKVDWEKGGMANMEVAKGYFELVLNAFEKNVGVAIFRNSNSGFDVSEISDSDEASTAAAVAAPSRKITLVSSLKSVTSILRKHHAKVADSELAVQDQVISAIPKKRFELMSKHSVVSSKTNPMASQMYRFRTRIVKGTIDVWWLKDDGGLTLLLPHLLSLPRSYLEGARLRIFTRHAASTTHVDKDQKNMAALLRRFHIDCPDLHVLTEFGDQPSAETKNEFSLLIEPYLSKYHNHKEAINENHLHTFHEKTRRCLRTGELMREHSADADLVIVTLPQARRGHMPAPLYLSWLEMMTRQLPPILMIRGDGRSVASYYS